MKEGASFHHNGFSLCSRPMRRLKILWIGWVLWFGVGLGAESQIVNGLSVIVNDAVITYKDVIQYVAPVVETLQRQYAGQPDLLRKKILQAQQEGLQQLIERQLILQEFKKAGYKLPDFVVEQEIQRRIREQFGGDRVALIRTLQSRGMTYEQWRRRVREDLIISAMRAKHMGTEVVVSPFAIEKYYAEHLDEFRLGDQVHVRTIMISVRNQGGVDQARQLAEEILKKLDEGVPFEELARIYSEDSAASRGGDRGWVKRQDLRKELAKIAFSLKPGQHSGIIETPGAFWILKVEGVRKNYIKTLPEVRAEIEEKLKNMEREKRYREWVDSLKKKAFIRYF